MLIITFLPYIEYNITYWLVCG